MTEAGLFSIDQTTRTARGILLPYGVKSKGISASGTKPITFRRGNVAIPRDPIVIGLNDEHERFHVIGRAETLDDTDEGIAAVFRIADTDEGDVWLAEHGSTAYFSAEIDDLVRHPGDEGAGRLAGAAVTKTPAFDGTGVALFSLLGTEETAPDQDIPDEVQHDPGPRPDETTDPTIVESEDEDEVPEQKEDDMGDALAPMLASRRKSDTPPLTKAGFFSALEHARRTGDKGALAPYAQSAREIGMFAVNNITYDDATGLAYTSGIPSTWLGELAAGARFQRTIVPLLTQATLQSLVATGWVWLTRPSVQRWSGNKTPVPSSTATTGPKDFTAQRFGNVNDLAREYYDFGVTEVINSFIEAVVDSYYVESDDFALEKLEEGATAFTPTSGTVSGMLAQMARKVLAARVQPTFAVVAPDVFDAFTDVTNSEQSAYFSPTIGLAGGDLSGIPLIPDDRLGAGEAIVGAKSAATAWELPGVPIRVTAPDLVLGGYDEAMFGYIAVGVTYPAGVVKSTLTLPAAATASKSSK